MIIVSACLAGVNCKYSGGNNCNKNVAEMVAKGEALPVCPEQLGGCPTPRPAAEIDGGTGFDVLEGRCRVRRITGEDVTEEFIKGAKEVLKLAEITGSKTAILKSKSPSCGYGKIYDGTFTGKLVEGNGVTTELLLKSGIQVRTENEIKKK